VTDSTKRFATPILPRVHPKTGSPIIPATDRLAIVRTTDGELRIQCAKAQVSSQGALYLFDRMGALVAAIPPGGWTRWHFDAAAAPLIR